MYLERGKVVILAGIILVFLLIPTHFSQAAAATVDPKNATYISNPQGLKGLRSWQIWKDPNSNRLYRVLAGTARQAQTIKAKLNQAAKQSPSLTPVVINDNIGTHILNAQELSQVPSWQVWKDPNNNRLYRLKAKTIQEAQKSKNNLDAGIEALKTSAPVASTPTTPSSTIPAQQPNTPPTTIPTISFTSPRGGEQWLVGTNHTINWTISPPLATSQSISLGLIQSGVPMAGLNTILSSQTSSFNWAIPTSMQPGNGYGVQILIIDQSSGNIITSLGGISNMFSITTATTPTAKEIPASLPVPTAKPAPVPTPTPTAKPSIKPYKLGLVYVYDGPDTYNPEWREKLEPALKKTVTALKNLLGEKINNPSVEILGEVKTSIFEWNPAQLGITWKTDTNTFYEVLPGSSFSTEGIQLAPGQTLVAVDCPTATKCETMIEGDKTIVRIKSDRALTNKNLWGSGKLGLLDQEISQKLGMRFEDYAGVFIVFGRLGQPLDTDPRYLEWACTGIHPGIAHYSNLVMSENFLLEPANYLLDCGKFKKGMLARYRQVGWHGMVHEVLHRLGTVDVFDADLNLFLKSQRDAALAIDPRTDESVMGDDLKMCMGNSRLVKNDQRTCTIDEVEQIYLDKYNRQKMGL